ncbi:MAG: RNA-binding transcriptional accessory protein [Anaerolineae bacterium]|nr:RNA-binding transcriptional accessory protein [Anaerolineae bacterium]
MSYAEKISAQLNIKPSQAASAIELLDEGNTIPFISRYRKEATGSLDEEQIRQIESLLARLRSLDERRAAILASIEEQGKMTDELRSALLRAETLTALEDLYQPYKPKRKTRASIAREKGLQPLADKILQQEISEQTAETLAMPFLNENVLTAEDALAGAIDIVAETISDHANVRHITRERAMQWSVLRSEKLPDAQDERRVYQVYYQFEGRVDRLRPHQVLAINRGEAEKVLRVQVEIPERDWRTAVTSFFRPDRRSPFADLLKKAMEDAAERLLLPAIERDVRRTLTETAEMHAVTVFASNLRALISQPPLAGYTVLGLDPGFRTGCKAAIVDSTGRLLDTFTIYPHEPQKQKTQALEILKTMVEKYGVTLIAIGNGTASRETEQLVAELIRMLPGLRYLIVNEAGASVYSASPLARAELPDLDVSLRGAVSIARRVQDPLAELVKIDPKSIGVGLYQHDVNQAELNHALDGVIESVVNNVGVEVNTASPALLTHVAGIGPKLAERIVAFREENGPFKNRFDLLKVNGLGPKVFEQAAGFLRIRGGDNPLDASAIHPESYPVAQAILQKAGISISVSKEEKRIALGQLQRHTPVEKLAAELGTGEPTLRDIFEQIIRPGRDPREDTPPPILRNDVLSMEDLLPGMRLKGTVRNVVDFGVFVDIGVKQDGLLHRSRIPTGNILQVGDIIEVEVLAVEVDRGRISLTWVSAA